MRIEQHCFFRELGGDRCPFDGGANSPLWFFIGDPNNLRFPPQAN